MNYERTAILLFSRTAKAEAGHKRFSNNQGLKFNIAVANKLISHSLSVARKSGLPFFTSFSNNQSGNNFGERLSNAAQDIFDKGFQSLIIIGNDCPQLESTQLIQTKHLLSSRPLVLGPTIDGGVYLIGIQREAFNKNIFTQLYWESDQLQHSWNSYAERHSHQVVWLDGHFDIDRGRDFEMLLPKLNRNSRLLRAFLSFMATIRTISVKEIKILDSISVKSSVVLRGPPKLAH